MYSIIHHNGESKLALNTLSHSLRVHKRVQVNFTITFYYSLYVLMLVRLLHTEEKTTLVTVNMFSYNSFFLTKNMIITEV